MNKEKLNAVLGKAKAVLEKVMPKSSILAIDMGTHAIKLLRLKPGAFGGRFTVETAYLIEINQQELPLNEEERKAYLARLLRTAFLRLKIRSPLVGTSVSGSSVIVREAKLPALPHSALRSALGVEAEPYLPFDVEEVHLDYHVTGQVVEKGEQKYSVLLVAAKKDYVANRLSLLTTVGARPVVVELDSLAVVNMSNLRPDQVKGSYAICNIGASITNLIILESGAPRLVRDIPIGGAVFTRVLQKELGLDPNSAEKAKREMGLIFDEAEQAQYAGEDAKKLQAVKGMAQVATDLMGEIGKSMTFYLTHGVESKIQKIYFTGGGALLKNLTPFASAQLKLPVEPLNPFEFFNLPPGVGAKPEDGPAFSVACGLALRQWNDWQKR